MLFACQLRREQAFAGGTKVSSNENNN